MSQRSLVTRCAKHSRLWLAVLAILTLPVVYYAFFADRSDLDVETAVCRRGTIREFVDERGMTRLPETLLISMPFSGRISAIPWEEGSEVRQGEVLAQVVPEDVENMLAEARAVVARLDAALRNNEDHRIETTALRQAQKYVETMQTTVEAAAARLQAGEARYNYADSNLRRIASLAQSGAAPQDELERVQLAKIEADAGYRQDRLIHAALLSLQAATDLLPKLIQDYIDKKALTGAELQQQRAEAAAKLQTVELQARRAVMTAPFDAVVLHRYVTSEQFLTAGTPLLELGRWDRLQVEADVLTQAAVRTKPGDRVDVFLGTDDRQPVAQGTVERIQPAAFTKLSSLGVEEQRVKVIIALSPEDIHELRRRYHVGVGYRVRVQIITNRRENALIVPRISLLRENLDEWFVWAVRGGRLEKQPVRVGLMNDVDAEILDGLREGETIVHMPDF